jgi:hypothetical protein
MYKDNNSWEFYHITPVIVLNMLKVLKIPVFIICICGSGISMSTETLLTPFEASFSLRYKGAQFGYMTRSLSALPSGEYLYSSDIKTTGLARLFYKDHVVEKSTWLYEDNLIKPIHYYYDRSGGKKLKEVTVDFNHETKQILTTVNGDSWKMPLEGIVFDKLLYQISIMHDLNLTQAQADIDYNIADGGIIKNYLFKYLGEEVIKTDLGSFKTIKMQRHKPNQRRKSTFWCAIELNYLPIKVENIESDGRKTIAIIKTLSGLGL